MIRKSGTRFSEKIMLKQRDEIMDPIQSNRIHDQARSGEAAEAVYSRVRPHPYMNSPLVELSFRDDLCRLPHIMGL